MNDQDLNKLYKAHSGEAPPKALDDAILNAAKASLPEKNNKRTMWLAAASVALVGPLLLWVSLNVTPTSIQRADDYFIQERSEPQKEAAPKPKAAPAPQIQQDVVMDAEEELDQGEITVTGSRIKRATESDWDNMMEKAATVSEPSESAPVATSIELNQAMLKAEFKAKKQRINKDTIADPMMALEWQQLQQYIEQNEHQKALELLQSLKSQWPDYDYSDLESQIEDMQ